MGSSEPDAESKVCRVQRGALSSALIRKPTLMCCYLCTSLHQLQLRGTLEFLLSQGNDLQKDENSALFVCFVLLSCQFICSSERAE